MKRFISAVIGITTFTSMSICSAFTGTYTFVNETHQPLCFGNFDSHNSTLTARPERIEHGEQGIVDLTTQKCGGAPPNPPLHECAYGSFKYGTNCPQHRSQTDACFVYYKKNDGYEFHSGTDGSLLHCHPVVHKNGTYSIIITK